MIYLILNIAVLLIGINLTNNIFGDKLPEIVKNLFQNITDFVQPHLNLIGWISFILGILIIFTNFSAILFGLVSISLGIYILNDELLKIPSIGEMLHNLSDGLSNYKEVLAILGLVFGILGFVRAIVYIF